jgi:sensor domain CHASE-containing protein
MFALLLLKLTRLLLLRVCLLLMLLLPLLLLGALLLLLECVAADELNASLEQIALLHQLLDERLGAHADTSSTLLRPKL